MLETTKNKTVFSFCNFRYEIYHIKYKEHCITEQAKGRDKETNIPILNKMESHIGLWEFPLGIHCPLLLNLKYIKYITCKTLMFYISRKYITCKT